MVTRRTLLAGSASIILLEPLRMPATALSAAEQEVSLKLESHAAPLTQDGIPVAVLAYAGLGAAPVIRALKGQAIDLRIENWLSEPTSLRWHGLRGLGALDDATTRTFSDIPPGESRRASVMPLDSGTSWFHAAGGATDQTARGARGVLIVEDTEAPAVDQDLVAILADWLISAEGQLQFGSTAPASTKAVLFTINGIPSPVALTGAPRSRVRLRLVNASAQRVMLVGCEGAWPMIVAIDGQPSDLFAPVRATMPIGPGARFEIVFDLPEAAGASVRLTLKGTERLGGALEPDRPLMVINTAGAAREPRPPIVALAANPALPRQIPLEKAKRADLVIDGTPGSPTTPPSGWTVNGMTEATAVSRPVLSVRQGDAVSLGLINKSPTTVPLHVQGQAMRLLHAKDDGWEPYWRDSILLPPNSSNHVAFVADTPGRWPIESGFDDLTRAGLHCWFEVKPRR